MRLLENRSRPSSAELVVKCSFFVIGTLLSALSLAMACGCAATINTDPTQVESSSRVDLDLLEVLRHVDFCLRTHCGPELSSENPRQGPYDDVSNSWPY